MPDVPADVLARSIMVWTQLFGFVSFDLFGHYRQSVRRAPSSSTRCSPPWPPSSGSPTDRGAGEGADRDQLIFRRSTMKTSVSSGAMPVAPFGTESP
jgi:hypothetical protein